jgi:predicted PurR-regulated permease PerM
MPADPTAPPPQLPRHQTASPTAPRHGRVPMATILTVFALALLLAASWKWSVVLLMGFAALLLAIALRGGAGLMNRWLNIPFKVGVLLTALLAALLILMIFSSAGPAISAQFNELLRSLPQSWDKLSEWLHSSSLGQFVERSIDQAKPQEQSAATDSLPSIFGYLTGTITSIFGGLANLILVLTMAIFLALDAPMYRRGFLRLVPTGYRPRAGQILDESGRALARWMGGQALDMLVVALLTGLGLWLLGVPLALVLGVIAGLTNIIPVIGPFMSGIPAVLFALTQGVDLALYVALLFLVIQQIEGNILMPMIQKYAAQLPPVLTVLAIVAFGHLFGLLGIILATPLLLVTIILVERIYVEDVLGDRPPDQMPGID